MAKWVFGPTCHFSTGLKNHLSKAKKQMPVFHYECQIEKVSNFLDKFNTGFRGSPVSPGEKQKLNDKYQPSRSTDDTIDKVFASFTRIVIKGCTYISYTKNQTLLFLQMFFHCWRIYEQFLTWLAFIDIILQKRQFKTGSCYE